MVKYIISCADVHIRNYKRMDEYKIQLKKFIEECKTFVKEHGSESVRIVILGDLLHNKLDISGEGYVLASQFLKELDKICKTIVLTGNHDVNMANLSRLDPLSTIFNMCNFKQTYLIDKELDYESGCLIDENITWVLYSTFDNFSKPNIEEARIEYPDNVFIGLYHGDVHNAKTDAGYTVENGVDDKHFNGLDFCLCGHIHKRQKLMCDGVEALYIGSLIQQDHGENINNHGYVILNTENLTYTEHNIENEKGFYTFTINNENDIDNNLEELINY